MYRLIGRLEQSQLADLFRAERTETSESVVIKLFHVRTSDAHYARSIAEVTRALQPVTHAGVARVLDIGMVDGRLAIVRQDTGRTTLGLALQRLNTRELLLPPALALRMAIDLLELIGAAHAAGVVHGALTPGNVLFGDDGQLSVVDFGALTALHASAQLQKSFGERGRSSYRAPELTAGALPTVGSDVYALGAIAYELLTLHEASTATTTVSLRSERLPPPSRLVRRLQSRIDPVLMGALELSPTRRHATCEVFAEGIREFLAASGGLPPLEDLKKFFDQLFPNEVRVAGLGPVPIERSFELTDIGGIGSIEAQALEADERASFSGGLVDDRTPTSDGLPVFAGEPVAAPEPLEPRAEVKTQPEVAAVAPRALSDWDAPPAAVDSSPSASQAGPTPEPVMSRVRAVEDFAALDGQPKPPPKPARVRVAKTLMTFALPFRREHDPSVPSLQDLETRGARTVRVVSFLATVVLLGTVGGSFYAFLRSTNDPRATLIGYLPGPLQRVFPPTRPPPPPVGKPLKLADFDKLHPEKAFNPNPPVEKPTPPPPPKKVDCYAAQKGKSGYLNVTSDVAVRVEIDGKLVCGSTTKVPVLAGNHHIVVVEPESDQVFERTTKFRTGKTVTLIPMFQR